MFRDVFTAALFAATTAAWINVVPPRYNERDFCVKYFGGMGAHIDVAKAVPKKNYNGSIECPREWDFPSLTGVVLTLCPPSVGHFGAVLDASILVGGGGRAGYKINLPLLMELENPYITNGSDLGLVEHNVPAVLAEDRAKSKTGAGAWFINGTGKAFIDDIDASKSYNHLQLDCGYLEDKHEYCGGPEDRNSDHGCWGMQKFGINRHTKMNFSIWFDESDARIDMWIEGEYMFQLHQNPSGTDSSVKLEFRGTSDLPSAESKDFWENSKYGFKLEGLMYNKGMRLILGDGGFPVFENSTGARFAVGNSTFLDTEDDKNDLKGGASWKISPSWTNLWASLLVGVFLMEGQQALFAWW